MDQFLQCLIDKDDADQCGKSFLGEASDVTHQRAGVCGDQQETEEGRPQADAGPQGEVGEAVLPERNTAKSTGMREKASLFKPNTHTHTINAWACQIRQNNILAELKQDFLKDENRPCASQDGEGLTSKKGVGYTSHGSSEQRLNGALETWKIIG